MIPCCLRAGSQPGLVFDVLLDWKRSEADLFPTSWKTPCTVVAGPLRPGQLGKVGALHDALMPREPVVLGSPEAPGRVARRADPQTGDWRALR